MMDRLCMVETRFIISINIRRDYIQMTRTHFKTQMRGYDKESVDAYIKELKLKNNRLRTQVNQLEQDLTQARADEDLVKSTLLEAQKTAEKIKEQAKRDGLVIYNQYVNDAKQIKADATEQVDQLTQTGEQMKTAMIEMKQYIKEVITGYQNYVDAIDVEQYFPEQTDNQTVNRRHKTSPTSDITVQAQVDSSAPKRYVVNFPS